MQPSLDIGLGETGRPTLSTYSKCEAQSEAISVAGRFVVALGQSIDADTNAACKRGAQEDMPGG